MPAAAGIIENRVYRFIREYGLLSGGEKVLAAVSGGPDSACMLSILNRLRALLDIQLHVAHLDHGLHGGSAEDAKYVGELAAGLGIPCTIERRDVAGWKEGRGISLEEAAREVRYKYLDEVARAIGAARVAVGHTRDDQVETTLMHYLRGTGIHGLRGLRPAAPIPYGDTKDGLLVIRPMLKVARQETAAWCRGNGLVPRADPANADPRFMRNRVRLELLPFLRQYNPEVDDALVRLADTAGEDADFIDSQASALFNAAVSSEGCLTCLDSGRLRGLPLALQRRIFRMALGQVYGSLRDIEAVHVEALVSLLFGSTGKCVHLPGGLVAANERSRMVISGPGAGACPWPALAGEYPLNVPGETLLPGWRVTADFMQENFFREDDIFSASLDASKAGRDLLVRGRRPGDRFHPLGMAHSRKLQDFMVDAAIPRSWRDSVPIACAGGQIAWVVGWRIDDRFKVDTGSTGVLRLEFHRRENAG